MLDLDAVRRDYNKPCKYCHSTGRVWHNGQDDYMRCPRCNGAKLQNAMPENVRLLIEEVTRLRTENQQLREQKESPSATNQITQKRKNGWKEIGTPPYHIIVHLQDGKEPPFGCYKSVEEARLEALRMLNGPLGTSAMYHIYDVCGGEVLLLTYKDAEREQR